LVSTPSHEQNAQCLMQAQRNAPPFALRRIRRSTDDIRNESAASRAWNDRAEQRIIAARPQVLHLQVIPAAAAGSRASDAP
jgi:hypothetical protein